MAQFSQPEFFPRASSYDQSSIFRSNCYLVVQHNTDNSFYNISFPEDRCEVITTDENEVATCDDLMQIVRDKLECLQFIPDEELRIQYKDDENAFVNLRLGGSFHDALRCAQAVSGTTIHSGS